MKESSNAHNTLTSSNGAPLSENGLLASTTVGAQGPITLHDFATIDHLSHFDRERIPERVVHAKGGGAFGYFEVTHPDITKYCRAKMFNKVGKRTPVAARFSTVAGESGSADTLRDPRGFALKFYTEEGNWDLVGNNTPIFFIRDPIFFPSFIHTQKREPSTHLQAEKRDVRQWDFFTLRPEVFHQISFLFSDRGIPDGFRHMNGYGSHTFANYNEAGELFYVKYHFKTDQGIRNLDVKKAADLASSDPDYAIRDLYEHIAAKDYPSWTLYIQVMTPEQAAKCAYDPFDVTKIWPHSDAPLIEVGRLCLNRNPVNYFAEIEQLAFAPAHFIPGIDTSPDKMLQGRLFSYADTHRYRLGVNYQQIPVNQPLNHAAKTYQRDGFMSVTGNMGNTPDYFPNSFNGPQPDPDVKEFQYANEGGVVKKYNTRDNDNYSQVSDFYNKTLNKDERARLASNMAGSLANATPEVIQRALQHLYQIDHGYANAVKRNIEAIHSERKEHPVQDSKPNPQTLRPPRQPFKVHPPSDTTCPRL